MVGIDVAQWLEQWVEMNLHAKEHVERKAEMHDQAKACAEEARGSGISVTELKEAADGDLETFLVRRQNAAYDRRGAAPGPASVAAREAGTEEVIPVYKERLDVVDRPPFGGPV